MAPINIKTVRQTSLLHIESNLDRLGLLSPTHDQRSQQQTGQIAFQPVLINKSKFLKASTHCTKTRKLKYRGPWWWGPWAGEAGARASIQPSKALCIPEKPPRILPVRRSLWPLKKEIRPWSDISFSLRNLPVQACDSRAQGFSRRLARRRSSCLPPSPNLVRTHPIEHYQALRDSAPCLSRAATLPKVTELELGRGAHLGTPSSTNHTAAVSQPTG